MSRSKKVKARKMFAAAEQGNSKQQWFTVSSKPDNRIFFDLTRPIFVIPADVASYDAIHDQMTWAMDAFCEQEKLSNYWNRKQTTAALAAIGITRPTTKENK